MTERTNQENVEIIADGKRPIILAVSTVIILLIVIAGIFVFFLTNKDVSKVVLLVLLIVIIVLGFGMIIFVEYERRNAARRKDEGAQRWVRSTFEAQYRRPKPSASSLTERSSWALLPRKWSTGTAVPEYSAVARDNNSSLNT